MFLKFALFVGGQETAALKSALPIFIWCSSSGNHLEKAVLASNLCLVLYYCTVGMSPEKNPQTETGAKIVLASLLVRVVRKA